MSSLCAANERNVADKPNGEVRKPLLWLCILLLLLLCVCIIYSKHTPYNMEIVVRFTYIHETSLATKYMYTSMAVCKELNNVIKIYKKKNEKDLQ